MSDKDELRFCYQSAVRAGVIPKDASAVISLSPCSSKYRFYVELHQSVVETLKLLRQSLKGCSRAVLQITVPASDFVRRANLG